MNSKNEVMMNKSTLLNLMSWMFGAIVFLIGVLNMFWGNDFGFGVFLLLLSFVYFPPVNDTLREWTGFSIHWAIKILLGIFILLAALGVGELFNKIDLMLMDLQ
jgi:hypothetical protein